MTEQSKFGQMPDAGRSEIRGKGPGGLRCDDWEAMLTDALDGVLSARDVAAFDAHAAGCAGCTDLLTHAKQGQEWLVYLHSEPEVPAALVSRILDKTTGAGAVPIPVMAGAAQGAGAAAAAIPLRRSFQETRLLMTVAMAFFSIALTLNMAGIKLTSLRLADLRPATIGNSLSREFHQTGAQISRFYYNARFMYQLESKMRELRRDTETPQTVQPKKAEPSSRNGEGTEPGLTAESPADGPSGCCQETGAGVRRLAFSVQQTGIGMQRPTVSEEQEKENRQPQVVHTGIEVWRAEAREEQETEVKELQLEHNDEAGPRRTAANAGNDGRSLA